MANIYARMTKINNAQGRSNYIGDPKRQEAILLQRKDLVHGWGVVSIYEKEKSHKGKTNWEAREIVVALPNKLSNDLKELEKVCEELVEKLIGKNHENEYAVHWNKGRTNLHVHLLFSEREREILNSPKEYKRDMWYDKETNRMTKANALGAELRYKKGERMKDDQGNLRYDFKDFTPKDPKFTEQSFLYTQRYTIQEVLKNHGYALDVQDNSTPYLSQKKLFKGASSEYLDIAKQYNDEVKLYNIAVKEHLIIEPDTIETYRDMRNALEKEIKKENRQSQSFSQKAISVVADIKNHIIGIIENFKSAISRATEKENINDWWDNEKDEIVNLLKENDNRESNQERLLNLVEATDNVIDNLEQSIEKIETQTKERKKTHGHSL